MFPYLLHGFYSDAVLGYMSLKTGKNTHNKCDYVYPQKEYIERDPNLSAIILVTVKKTYSKSEYFQPQKEDIKRDPHLSAIVLFMVTTSVSPPPPSHSANVLWLKCLKVFLYIVLSYCETNCRGMYKIIMNKSNEPKQLTRVYSSGNSCCFQHHLNLISVN
jgi:hypothetical protein